MSKGLELLKTNVSVANRVESFYASIKRNLQRDMIDTLIAKKEVFEDKIFELKDFTLQTDLNTGQIALTKNAAESKFRELVKAEYELSLLELEITLKTKIFNEYFGEEVKDDKS